MRDGDTDLRVRQAYERVLAPGETVFSEGEPGDALYVVQSGEIDLVRRGAGGPRLLARVGAGEFFGELAVVEGARRSARAVAVGEARVLRLDRATLEALCVGQPEVAIRLIRGLAARLLDAERRAARIDTEDVLRPLLRALLAQAEPDASRGVRIPTTLRQLAEAAGLELLEAHHALGLLFEQGILHLVEDVLVAPDAARLASAADSLEP